MNQNDGVEKLRNHATIEFAYHTSASFIIYISFFFYLNASGEPQNVNQTIKIRKKETALNNLCFNVKCQI